MKQVGVDIKVTNVEVVKLFTSCRFATEQSNIPSDLSYACNRTHKRLDRRFEDISDKERELLSKYARKKENGNLLIEDNAVVFKTLKDKEAYDKGQKALGEELFEFTVYTCSPDVIDELKAIGYTGPTWFLSALLDIVIGTETDIKTEAEARAKEYKEPKAK